MNLKRLSLLIALSVFVSSQAHAHRLKLDKYGCHKYKKASEYHCHDKDYNIIERMSMEEMKEFKSSKSPKKITKAKKSKKSVKKAKTTSRKKVSKKSRKSTKAKTRSRKSPRISEIEKEIVVEKVEKKSFWKRLFWWQ